MNKRITSLLLCFIMVFALMAIATPAFADPSEHPAITFTIKPDKTTAKPGDTIAYQAILGPVVKLQSVQFELVIPEELEFINGSCPDGLAAKLGAHAAEFAPSTKIYASYGAGEYTSTGDTVLVNFTCKVKEGVAAGKNPVISITDQVFSDSVDGDYVLNFDPNSSAVTITAAPKPATGISLNKSELTLNAGDNDTSLTATVTPGDSTDTVVWSSNKPEVATVNPTTGEVNAAAPGEAIITAKAGTKTATCTVKVNCTHGSLNPVPEKDSNCTEKGWDAYNECILCGKLFDMSDNPIDAIPYRALNDNHDFNTSEWGYKGADGHAHVCRYNAEHHDVVQPHTPDHEGGATYEYAVKCTDCGLVLEPQRERGSVRVEVPFKLTVKKTGEMTPGQETFHFVIEEFGAPTIYTLVQDTVETNGEKTYEGKFIFTLSGDQAGNLSEGFVIRQVKGNADGWTYDETKFYAIPVFADSYESIRDWSFLKFDQNNEMEYNNPLEEIGFTNSYSAKKPVTPPAPQDSEAPKAGDNSMKALWITLLLVSAASLTGTTLYSRKKRANN
ncbi:Ig-like domain-containing protein [Eshraghiella crossota]|nr:Ig-like domain-containing protein [Butyrivibrio crossotus]UWO50499.1 Ig-like domain-containing protein [Butyrivibrio crossotus]